MPSGVYHCRAKVGGKLIRQSLKTKSIEIAKLKLDKELGKHRAVVKVRQDERLTVGHFAGLYLQRIERSDIKPRSKDYRRETWEMICRTWEGVAAVAAYDITAKDCESWAERAKERYSEARFNGCLETIHGIFKEAISAGECFTDPSEKIDRVSVPIVEVKLPTAEQFHAMLAIMDGHGRKKAAAFTIRCLAFTGLRVNELDNVAPGDIDLKAGWLLARVTKNGDPRRVPIIGEAAPVLAELKGGRKVVNCRRALKTGSKDFPQYLTPHDMRHLFATRCIESGVDIRTVAGWLGHKDGGALLLRRYAHLRDEHSKTMAAKVKFGT